MMEGRIVGCLAVAMVQVHAPTTAMRVNDMTALQEERIIQMDET